MLIDIKDVEKMIKEHLPGFAANHPGVKLLIKFVGRTVGAVNHLDERLVKLEKRLNATDVTPPTDQ